MKNRGFLREFQSRKKFPFVHLSKHFSSSTIICLRFTIQGHSLVGSRIFQTRSIVDYEWRVCVKHVARGPRDERKDTKREKKNMRVESGCARAHLNLGCMTPATKIGIVRLQLVFRCPSFPSRFTLLAKVKTQFTIIK